jgi:hypothetical protein
MMEMTCGGGTKEQKLTRQQSTATKPFDSPYVFQVLFLLFFLFLSASLFSGKSLRRNELCLLTAMGKWYYDCSLYKSLAMINWVAVAAITK